MAMSSDGRGKLNPWAQEFTPLYAYITNVQKPAPPLYPPPPPSFLPPPTLLNTPMINYNIYTAPHLHMNYVHPIAPPSNTSPSCDAVETPVMRRPIPIPIANTDVPSANISTDEASDLQGFMAAPGTQKNPSRSLLLSTVPPVLSEEELHQELKAWGPIRALHLQRKHQGLVTVDYYDLRHANQALTCIKQRHIMQQRDLVNRQTGKEIIIQQESSSSWGLIGGKAVWAQYAIPTSKNQGTLVVFNLDDTLSWDSIRSVFEQYGAVKEVREPPLNNQIKFVEFFDVRDADRAREGLDEQEIGSKRVKIQFSHLCSPAIRGGTNKHSNMPRGQTSLGNDQAGGRCFGIGRSITSSNCSRGSFHGFISESSSQFAFDEGEAKSKCAQARTTLMIKNIPNKYDLDMLLKMLDSHCLQYNKNITEADEPLSEYDFVYLPIDFKNKCNLGYAFVNFTSGIATWKLYRDLHMHQWAIFNSEKICEVTYARLQGRSALEGHFRKGRLEWEKDNYLPLVFDPPRNGQNLTTTRVICGHWQPRNSGNKHQREHHYRQNRGQNYNRVNSDSHSSRHCCGPTYFRVKSSAAADHLNKKS